MLEAGTKAPNFTLQDREGKFVSLSDFIGKKVVLYFYPKDNTPGCSRQACAFAASYDAFKAKDIAVIASARTAQRPIRSLRRSITCRSSCSQTRI